jgi:TniQ
MADIRPLPRSLDPLPHESLPGYLLRLAHRVALSPARLATLTGLNAGSSSPTMISTEPLFRLPPQIRDTFARATRLTPAEVDGLCLDSLGGRYRLPQSVFGGRWSVSSVRSPQWVFAPATRYCPQCLVGDDNPVQRDHGGAWRKSWHLPVVFACLDHRRLLRHQCPNCRQPAHGSRPRSPLRLLPSMHAARLHPAQCRTSIDPASPRRLSACCATRLDTDTTAGPDLADSTLVDLQRRLVDLLRPDGPQTVTSAGQVTDPARYFTDLRILTVLLCTSWPAARDMTSSPEIANAIDSHVDQQNRRIADLQKVSPTAWTHGLLDAPPLDAAATAGLLAIADSILNLANPDDVRERLRPLLPASTRQARRSRWGSLVHRSRLDCSDGLRQACRPLLQSFTRVGGMPHAPRDAVRHPTRVGPEHIPAFLPQDWYHRHFSHLDDVNIKLLRRTATVRTVQMITGGSLDAAAAFLGINPTGKQYKSANTIYRQWANKPTYPQAFDEALLALISELDAAPELVNYQRRRDALQDWSLDPATWQDITARLPPTPGPNQPKLDDRKRQCASEVVWARATQGEHLFAPRPIEAAQPPHVQRAWQSRRNTTWHLFEASRLRHYAELNQLLDDYADRLAASIDSTA